jgi:hypothetical protein
MMVFMGWSFVAVTFGRGSVLGLQVMVCADAHDEATGVLWSFSHEKLKIYPSNCLSESDSYPTRSGIPAAYQLAMVMGTPPQW